ncbi:MAG: SigB/SigF/SigG family RNA polymerase sigma factor [Firmicutes bacterium]|nr:SigB/SigF/SigG family RNA polymerase sigma factor [Bacillota bacterium]MDY3658919.1 SigB/SigF/SigG family RNA polymerase sigma factor [Eubacteriales bacterium]
MLDHETTINLILKAQKGDQNAKNTLVCENSPLIKSIIKRFIGKGIEYDDLFQLGAMGFVKAINNFDVSYNVKFSTYVVPMIIGEVKRFMRDDGAIKVSRTIKTFNLQINKFIEQYLKENGVKPSIETIAKNFDVPSQEVVFAMDSARMPISLYTPFEDDEEKSLLVVDRFVQNTEADEMFDNMFLCDVMKKLEKRDKKIILLRYFRDRTQSEIAKELGISQVQVSRLETKILEKIRSKLAK